MKSGASILQSMINRSVDPAVIDPPDPQQTPADAPHAHVLPSLPGGRILSCTSLDYAASITKGKHPPPTTSPLGRRCFSSPNKPRRRCGERGGGGGTGWRVIFSLNNPSCTTWPCTHTLTHALCCRHVAASACQRNPLIVTWHTGLRHGGATVTGAQNQNSH